MATQKQRKRRAKEKRHDYDLVYIDEDGVEQPVEREDEPRKPTGRGSKGDGVEELDVEAALPERPSEPRSLSHRRGARCSSAARSSRRSSSPR